MGDLADYGWFWVILVILAIPENNNNKNICNSFIQKFGLLEFIYFYLFILYLQLTKLLQFYEEKRLAVHIKMCR